ncbi:MAG: hypothetical protein JWP58_4215 [Hymenobacter sp.]|nr:hypothetical protein [Hymenobacter sp.]
MEEESAGTGERSQFKAPFADAHRRRFDLVLFWSLDRFSREGALPTLQYLNQLERWGVGYKSLTEQYLDSLGPFGDVIVSMLATIAAQDLIKISENTKAALAKKQAAGIKLGPPMKSAAVVEQALALKGEGKSNGYIARTLSISPSTVAKYVAP